MVDIYNFIIPILILIVGSLMVLDGKRFATILNGGIGMILGGVFGMVLARTLNASIFTGILISILCILAGYQIKRIKIVYYSISSGLAWAVFAVIFLSLFSLNATGLVLVSIFFFLAGSIFAYYYYSEILMISGYGFLGGTILFICSFYGIENISHNYFEIFYYKFAYLKFIQLFRVNFFYFLLIVFYITLFSLYFQKIKNRNSADDKSRILNTVLEESGYTFAILFMLSETFRIVLGADSVFLFGFTVLNWPLFVFVTYWMIAYIRKQEQIDHLVEDKKTHKPILYVYGYSVIAIPLLAFITSFGSFNLGDYFKPEIWIYLPKWVFSLLVMPLSIYLLYPKQQKSVSSVPELQDYFS